MYSGGWRGRDGPAAVVENLIGGLRLPYEVESELANRYIILVLEEWEGTIPGRADGALVKAGLDVTPSTPLTAGAVTLVPDSESTNHRWVTSYVRSRFGPRARCATATRARTEIPAGYAEAVDVLSLACAACRPAGVYRFSDVLVEYAVSRNDVASGNLAETIQALMPKGILFETLYEFVRADCNRNRAAVALRIHRSTLEYRLRRIAEITGYDPTDRHGSQVLGAAMTVHMLSERESGRLAIPGVAAPVPRPRNGAVPARESR